MGLRSAISRILGSSTRVGRVTHSCPELHLGTEYGGWTINPTLVEKTSIVYSAGVGEDISFDLALIERFGVTVHGFDPTPRSIRWVRGQNVPREFVLHEYGFAREDGTLVFHMPENPDHVSLSTVERPNATERVELPVRNLAGIMKELGHTHIDLLKMDIEGSEYEVIEDLLARGIEVKQLLIEYHHRFPKVGNQKTLDSIELLREHGYLLFHIAKSELEYSFVRVSR